MTSDAPKLTLVGDPLAAACEGDACLVPQPQVTADSLEGADSAEPEPKP